MRRYAHALLRVVTSLVGETRKAAQERHIPNQEGGGGGGNSHDNSRQIMTTPPSLSRRRCWGSSAE